MRISREMLPRVLSATAPESLGKRQPSWENYPVFFQLWLAMRLADDG